MNYPLRIPDQLTPHLRALRKSQGLTQAQLGALVGVKQARIAEIEANPGAVSLDQLVKLLAVLGATLHLHAVDTRAPADHLTGSPGRRAASKASKAPAAGPGGAGARGAEAAPGPADKQRTAPQPAAPRACVVIPANKGSW